jgi:hypothetical protein
VGVKLIGNDNVNTRWWYVISCSDSVIAEAPKCENVVNQNSISKSLGDLLQVPYINDQISWLTHKQQSKKIKLPSFDVMETSYPYGSTDQVKSEIGGKINADWINNTCAIRMSRVLNYSVPELQISKQGNLTISGNDKKWYFYRVSDLIKYLTNNLGKADVYLTRTNTGEIDISKLKDKKGIIIFEVPFADATGHATLWNGKNCVDEQCYFDRATAIYLWLSE